MKRFCILCHQAKHAGTATPGVTLTDGEDNATIMSAPISLHPNQRKGEQESEEERKSPRLELFRKERKGGERTGKQKNKHTLLHVFLP